MQRDQIAHQSRTSHPTLDTALLAELHGALRCYEIDRSMHTPETATSSDTRPSALNTLLQQQSGGEIKPHRQAHRRKEVSAAAVSNSRLSNSRSNQPPEQWSHQAGHSHQPTAPHRSAPTVNVVHKSA